MNGKSIWTGSLVRALKMSRRHLRRISVDMTVAGSSHPTSPPLRQTPDSSRSRPIRKLTDQTHRPRPPHHLPHQPLTFPRQPRLRPPSQSSKRVHECQCEVRVEGVLEGGNACLVEWVDLHGYFVEGTKQGRFGCGSAGVVKR